MQIFSSYDNMYTSELLNSFFVFPFYWQNSDAISKMSRIVRFWRSIQVKRTDKRVSAGQGHTGGALLGAVRRAGAPRVVGYELHPGLILFRVVVGSTGCGRDGHIRRRGLVLLAAAGEQLLAGALQQRHAALRLQAVHLGADGVLLEDPA